MYPLSMYDNVSIIHSDKHQTCFVSNLELLQRSDSGIETMLWQTAGEKVNPRLFWGLPVHLFRIHIEVLQLTKTHAQHARRTYAYI